jgi:hypothetical protein
LCIKRGLERAVYQWDGASKKFLKIFSKNPKVPQNAAVTLLDSAVLRLKKICNRP